MPRRKSNRRAPPTNVNYVDPRHHASRVTASGDPRIKQGHVVVRLEAARRNPDDDLPEIVFWAPLPWLLFLDFSAQRALDAERKRQSMIAGLRHREGGRPEPSPKGQTIALDAIAAEAASVHFSYAAVEAFANQGLWQKGRGHRFEVKRRGIIRLVAPDELERTAKLGEKVKRHLPSTTGRPRLHGALYADFLRLEKLRHSTAHTKVSERWGADAPETESPLGLLLRGTVQGPRVAAGILEHFAPGTVPPAIAQHVDMLPAHRHGPATGPGPPVS